MCAEHPLYLRATIDDYDIPAWRLLRLDPTLTLDDLLVAVRIAFGWSADPNSGFIRLNDQDLLAPESWAAPPMIAAGVADASGIPGSRSTTWDRIGDVLPAEGAAVAYNAGPGTCASITVERVAPPSAAKGAKAAVGEGSAAAELADAVGTVHKDGSPGARSIRSRRQFVERVNAELAATISAPATGVEAPTEITEPVAEHLTAHFQRLIDLVPSDGLRLEAGNEVPAETLRVLAAGFAGGPDGAPPPADQAALGLALPATAQEAARALGEVARRLGLIRLAKGVYYRTKVADRTDGDPIGLWEHIASRALPSSLPHIERGAGALVCCALGDGRTRTAVEYASYVAEWLTPAGWARMDGTPMDADDGRATTAGVSALLRLIDAWANGWEQVGGLVPTPAGVAAARDLIRASLPQDLGHAVQTLFGGFQRESISDWLAMMFAEGTFDDDEDDEDWDDDDLVDDDLDDDDLDDDWDDEDWDEFQAQWEAAGQIFQAMLDATDPDKHRDRGPDPD
ncbi:MAG: hypothetical protein LBG60_13720 [Bifidobacteriaceae bacterium]|jgi:hypothetical protein|nr:hypothetical protein [Bifidobacteriaceae bacterium]